jgi:glycine hydroxymethyltransferase
VTASLKKFEKVLKKETIVYQKIKKQDPAIYKSIRDEVKRQQDGLELIASENFTSEAVMEAQGCVMTNKYAEGYPGKRYYGGCENVDVAETIAIERAKKLFGAEHANVQAHSGTQANIAVLMTFLQPGDTILGLQLAHGGHLSHGHPLNFSGKFFKVVGFGVSDKTELIDYEQAERLVQEHKPKLLCIGASAYAREVDWARFRKMADSVGAIFMADVAHYAGLIVAGLYPSPVPYADVVTTTTHKTLRGPRGGLILCKQKYAADIDRSVFPGDQGGPLMHVIAAKAIAFGEALKPAFRAYQKQVKENAATLADALTKNGLRIVTGGTDCHMFLVDLRPKNITGKDAEIALGKAGITTNKNAIPFDPQKPFIASGIRLGSPAVTTRGMKKKEMILIANWITRALDVHEDTKALAKIHAEVTKLCSKFPLYKEHLK